MSELESPVSSNAVGNQSNIEGSDGGRAALTAEALQTNLQPNAILRPSEAQKQQDAGKKLPKLSRRELIAQRRQDFSKGLFNEDLKQLAEWHRYRSPAEQKRFLKSVDGMFTLWTKKGESFDQNPNKTVLDTNLRLVDIPEDQIIPGELLHSNGGNSGSRPDSATLLRTKTLEKAMDSDALHQGLALDAGIGAEIGGGSKGGSMKSGKSLPSLKSNGSNKSGMSTGGMSAGGHSASSTGAVCNKNAIKLTPIGVHNSRRRKIYAPESQTMDQWLEANSQASTRSVSTDVSDYSRWTGISEMSATTEGSLESAPCPVMKTQFRHHVRGYAINRRKWRTKGNQEGVPIPHQSYPADRRFQTSTKCHYPNPFGEKDNQLNKLHKDPRMYTSVFRPGSHAFVDSVLHNDMKEKDLDQFLYMVRCLHQVRLESKPRTQTERDYDFTENKRLYHPTRSRPYLDPQDLRKSSVPLGCLNENLNKYQVTLGMPHLITPEEYAMQLKDDAERDAILLLDIQKKETTKDPALAAIADMCDGSSDIFGMGSADGGSAAGD